MGTLSTDLADLLARATGEAKADADVLEPHTDDDLRSQVAALTSLVGQLVAGGPAVVADEPIVEDDGGELDDEDDELLPGEVPLPDDGAPISAEAESAQLNAMGVSDDGQVKADGWAACPSCGSADADEYADGTARCEDCGMPLVRTEVKGFDFDGLDDALRGERVDDGVKALATRLYGDLGDLLGVSESKAAGLHGEDALVEWAALQERRAGLSA